MGRAPYKSAKESGEHSLSVPNLTLKEQPCHIYRDSMPLTQSNGDARVLEFSSDSIRDYELTVNMV